MRTKLNKNTNRLVSLVVLLVVFLSAILVIFNTTGKKGIAAAASGASELYVGSQDPDGKVFDQEALQELYKAIGGNSVEGLADLQSLATAEREVHRTGNITEIINATAWGNQQCDWKTMWDEVPGETSGDKTREGYFTTAAKVNGTGASDFANSNIVVQLGGLAWYPTFLSTADNGHIIVTLWLASNDGTSIYGNDNTYGSSVIRDMLVGETQLEKYKVFTQGSETGNSLSNYIVTPSDVSYQASESIVDKENQTTDYTPSGSFTNESTDSSWNTDKLWLPSYNEVGVRAMFIYVPVHSQGALTGYTYTGSVSKTSGDKYPNTLWNTTDTQTSAGLSLSGDEGMWLRTSESSGTAHVLNARGMYGDSQNVGNSNYVRPALHLDLTLADADSAETVDPSILVLENTTTETVMDEEGNPTGDFTQVYSHVFDGTPGQITLISDERVTVADIKQVTHEGNKITSNGTDVGDYQLVLTLEDGYIWKDGGARNKLFTIRITPRPVNVSIGGSAQKGSTSFVPAITMFEDVLGGVNAQDFRDWTAQLEVDTVRWADDRLNDPVPADPAEQAPAGSKYVAEVITLKSKDGGTFGNNFQVVNIYGFFEITNLQIIAPTLPSYVFNGNEQGPADESGVPQWTAFGDIENPDGRDMSSITWAGLFDGTDGSATVNKGTNAGSYTVVLTLDDDAYIDYIWYIPDDMQSTAYITDYGRTLTVNYTIYPRNVIASVSGSKEYSGSPQSADILFADGGVGTLPIDPDSYVALDDEMLQVLIGNNYTIIYSGISGNPINVSEQGYLTTIVLDSSKDANFVSSNYTVSMDTDASLFKITARKISVEVSGSDVYDPNKVNHVNGANYVDATIVFTDKAENSALTLTDIDIFMLIYPNYKLTYGIGGAVNDGDARANAGIYTVTFILTDAARNNFILVANSGDGAQAGTDRQSGTYEIAKAELAQPTIRDTQYNGAEQFAKDFVSTVDTALLTIDNVFATDANEEGYEVKIAISEQGKLNYQWPQGADADENGAITLIWKINKRSVWVNLSGNSSLKSSVRDYDDFIVITFNDGTGNTPWYSNEPETFTHHFVLNATYEYRFNRDLNSGNGTYQIIFNEAQKDIWLLGDAANNFVINSVSGYFVVYSEMISFSNYNTFVYNGSVCAPEFTQPILDICQKEDGTYDIVWSQATDDGTPNSVNVGTYTVTLTIQNPEYIWDFSQGGRKGANEKQAIFTYYITPFDISTADHFEVEFPELEYTGRLVDLTGIDVKVLLDGQEVNLYRYTDYALYTNQIAAGSGYAILTGVNNYAGVQTVYFEVAPREIEIELLLQSSIYGETIVLSTDMRQQNATTGGAWRYAEGSKQLVEGETFGLVIARSNNNRVDLVNGAPVGLYDLDISYSNSNYSLTYSYRIEQYYTTTYTDGNVENWKVLYDTGVLGTETIEYNQQKITVGESVTIVGLYYVEIRELIVDINDWSIQYRDLVHYGEQYVYGQDIAEDESNGIIGQFTLSGSNLNGISAYHVVSSNGTGTPIYRNDTITITLGTTARTGFDADSYPIYVVGNGSHGPAGGVKKYIISFQGSWADNDSLTGLTEFTEGAGTLIINPRKISDPIDSQSFVYNGAVRYPDYKDGVDTGLFNANWNGNGAIANSITVGVHSVTFTFKDTKNYVWESSNAVTLTITYQITRREITVSFDGNANTATYIDEEIVPTLVFSDSYSDFDAWAMLADNDSLLGLGTYLQDKCSTTYLNANGAVSTSIINAGTYTLYTVRLDSDISDNFVLAIDPSGKFEVDKAEVTVSVVALDKVYDGTTTAQFTWTVNGLYVGDSVTITIAGNFSGKDVADDLIDVSYNVAMAEHINYKLGGKTEGTTSAKITPAEVYVVRGITAQGKTYDGTVKATLDCTNITWQVVGKADTGLYGSDTLNLVATGEFVEKNAGTNLIVNITGMELVAEGSINNYTLNSGHSLRQTTTTASIAHKEVSVLQDAFSVVDRIYNSMVSAIVTIGDSTFAEGAICNGDQVTVIATGRFADKNVGYQDVTIDVALIGPDAGNYTLALTQFTVKASITARAVSITGLENISVSKVYDGSLNAQEWLTLSTQLAGNTATYLSEYFNGDDVTVKIINATFADKNVGSDKIVRIEFALEGEDAANYNLAIKKVDVSCGDITAKTITIYQNGLAVEPKQYDGTTVAKVSYGNTNIGFVENDNVRLNLVGMFDSADIGEHNVEVNISLIGGDSQNYSLNISKDELSALDVVIQGEITPKQVKIVWEDLFNFVYNGAAQDCSRLAYFIDVNGVKQYLEVKVYDADQSDIAAFKNAGEYVLVASMDDNSAPIILADGQAASDVNYSITNTDNLRQTASIAKAALTIDVLVPTKIYDGNVEMTPSVVLISTYGAPDCDQVSFAVKSVVFADPNVGYHTVTLTLVLNGDSEAAANFTLAGGTFDEDTATYRYSVANREIIQATNTWVTEYSRDGWHHNQNATAEVTPVATFGQPAIAYFTDATCQTPYSTDDWSTANAGTYYVKVSVEASEIGNYTGISSVYSFTVVGHTYIINAQHLPDYVNTGDFIETNDGFVWTFIQDEKLFDSCGGFVEEFIRVEDNLTMRVAILLSFHLYCNVCEERLETGMLSKDYVTSEVVSNATCTTAKTVKFTSTLLLNKIYGTVQNGTIISQNEQTCSVVYTVGSALGHNWIIDEDYNSSVGGWMFIQEHTGYQAALCFKCDRNCGSTLMVNAPNATTSTNPSDGYKIATCEDGGVDIYVAELTESAIENKRIEIQGTNSSGIFKVEYNGENKIVGMLEVFTSALGHVYNANAWVGGALPTCTQSGTIGHFECVRCREWVDIDGKLIPEEERSDGERDALGHSYKTENLIAEVAATCETEGKQAHYVCERCNEWLDASGNIIPMAEHTIAALGHNYKLVGWIWTQDDNGTWTATAHFICQTADDCGALCHIDGQDATVEGVILYSVEPDCSSSGRHIYVATVNIPDSNGMEETDYYFETVAAIGHSWNLSDWAWGVDYNSATATFICDVCGDVTSVNATVTIEASDTVVDHIAMVIFDGKTYTINFPIEIILPPEPETTDLGLMGSLMLAQIVVLVVGMIIVVCRKRK